ncbi:hypothetical protein FRC00_004754, partial [Tulasnella sp. 408]
MDHPLEADTSPSAQSWHSEPDTTATDPLLEDAGKNEARIHTLRAPADIAVDRLPAEIWIAVCEALRRLDSIDVANRKNAQEDGYAELQRKTTNKNRPDMIITAVSILQLSQTCRYLHKVTSPSLLETIRLSPPSGVAYESRYLSVIEQVKSLQLNSNQRLQHVRGFAVALQYLMWEANRDHGNNLRDRICHLLTRFPNLRHLTVILMPLDAPLMRTILTLPLEHLWLFHVKPDNPITDHTFIFTTAPKIKLQSFLLWQQALHGVDEPRIPVNWISQLIGTAMQE